MTESELRDETLQHISDVRYLLGKVTLSVEEQGLAHDHDKLGFGEEGTCRINGEFYDMACNRFRDCEWWQEHKKEGHHTPKTLVDLIEKVADGIAACARRRDLSKYHPVDFTEFDLVGMFKELESMLVKQMKRVL